MTNSRNTYTIVTNNGKYNVARVGVGVGDGLWVDNEGVLYINRTGRIFTKNMISSALEEIPKGNFNKTILVPNSSRFKGVETHKFGKRNLFVGENGVLYQIKFMGVGVYGFPIGNCNGFTSQLNKELESQAWQVAKSAGKEERKLIKELDRAFL